MANRPQQLELPAPRTYSRTEFTALRARVKGLPIATIARAYFDPEATEPIDVERLLRTMRDDLVAVALREGSSVLVSHLKASIAKHGEVRLTPVTLQLIEEAAGQWATVQLALEHPLSRWFRPLVAQRLAGEGIRTIGELVAFIERCGGNWWRSIPRIGVGRARVLVAWLRRHAQCLGRTVTVEVELADPLAASTALLVTRGADQLAPLERLAVPAELAGTAGANRAAGFAYIRAAHDLDAVRAYLHRYDERLETQRAYKRELERLVLWCVADRGVALSSMTVEDCEAYKSLLKAPGERFTGPPVARTSRQSRPFAPGGLSPESQRYAVRTIRAAFTWFVHVRYLAGNPWRAVTDPATVKRARKLQVERALSLDLWTRVRTTLADRAEQLGTAGERWRAALVWLPADDETPASWLLEVIGKGMKQRFVPLSGECVDAMRAHWRDRDQDFEAADADGPLIAPLIMPPTARARAKFGLEQAQGDAMTSGATSGYSVRGARGLTQWAIGQLLDELPELSDAERRKLHRTASHAFRHTVATQMLASGAALEVVQQTLRHASLGTTSIYISPEQGRLRREAAKYHIRLKQS
jgi:integrase/recombinase XerD